MTPTINNTIKKNGQYWTPRAIAIEMARRAMANAPDAKNILDPASGAAAFSEAFYSIGVRNIILSCYDIDERWVKYTRKLNKKYGFPGKTVKGDYLKTISLEGLFDVVIMNPPYIRQENISVDDKKIYYKYMENKFDMKINRRSNLFTLFMMKGILDLKPGGVLCAIVYDAISQSAYGKAALKMLFHHAETIYCEKIKMPFENVIVDAQILIFRKRLTPLKVIEIMEGEKPKGFVALREILNTKRGTCFPRRELFIARRGEPFYDTAEPFFMKQSNLKGLIVAPDSKVYFLSPSDNIGILSWFKKHAFEKKCDTLKVFNRHVKGKILFNYYIRHWPRHLWNPNLIAASDNFYVSNTRGEFPAEAAWLLLNSNLYLDQIMKAGRNQGNGLMKLQLYEYEHAFVPDWRMLKNSQIERINKTAIKLIKMQAEIDRIKKVANRVTKNVF